MSEEAVLRRLTDTSGQSPGAGLTVAVPIHDAYEALLGCLDSLARPAGVEYRLLLLDDASPDPRVGRLLDSVSGLTGLEVRRWSDNRGFVHAANVAFAESPNDVVLLNSDTRG